MPRLSAQVWEDRRRHVHEAAWRCFARSGYHATSMDDVIAESGWSASVVYRYVRGKDELVRSASAEAFLQLQAVAARLAAQPPVSPAEAVVAFGDLLDDAGRGRSYSLAGLVLHTWAGALHDRTLAEGGRRAWDEVRGGLEHLARAWQDGGLLPERVRPSDVAAALALVVPGMIVDGTFLGDRGTDGLVAMLRGLTGEGSERIAHESA